MRAAAGPPLPSHWSSQTKRPKSGPAGGEAYPPRGLATLSQILKLASIRGATDLLSSREASAQFARSAKAKRLGVTSQTPVHTDRWWIRSSSWAEQPSTAAPPNGQRDSGVGSVSHHRLPEFNARKKAAVRTDGGAKHVQTPRRSRRIIARVEASKARRFEAMTPSSSRRLPLQIALIREGYRSHHRMMLHCCLAHPISPDVARVHQSHSSEEAIREGRAMARELPRDALSGTGYIAIPEAAREAPQEIFTTSCGYPTWSPA
jgi:hypothetical protein